MLLNYKVTLKTAWVIKDVTDPKVAISIAISEAGKRLHPSAKYVDIEIDTIKCPSCGIETNGVYIVAKTAIVGLLLSMTVFNAESSEHAEHIAKSVIGHAIHNISIESYKVEQLPSEPEPEPEQNE